ncbi:MAG: peptidase M28, partial [Flavobacteriaceae bacterium]|nr:peptidase M28 [Flavobacteriaceae bacterium]
MIKKIIALFILILASFYSVHSLYPDGDYITSPKEDEFSNLKAKKHVIALSEAAHYTTGKYHESARNYIIDELKKSGLQPEVQIGYSHDAWGNYVKTKNVVAKIEGTSPNGKALMLMTHYDSAPHSSYGASDA